MIVMKHKDTKGTKESLEEPMALRNLSLNGHYKLCETIR